MSSKVSICRIVAAGAVGAVMLACILAPACRKESPGPLNAGELRGDLTIFHAGSLSVPLRRISDIFVRRHPSVTIKAEAAGSRHCARKITDLDRQCDVMASADHTVISTLLMGSHADFNIRFATNEMVIAYTDRSRLAATINAKNWHEVLLAGGVAFGRSDPNRDPCGYRSVMVMQLAEKHLGIEGLAVRLEAAGGKKYIRPKETDLLALLEVGEIDYLFIYRSVAEQHGLKMILLDDSINLASAALAELYATAAVKVTGKAPGEYIVKRGTPMVYSVTIPRNSPNRRAAEAYVALLLSEEGRAVLEASGQPTAAPAPTDGFDKLPKTLRPFCEPLPSPEREAS